MRKNFAISSGQKGLTGWGGGGGGGGVVIYRYTEPRGFDAVIFSPSFGLNSLFFLNFRRIFSYTRKRFNVDFFFDPST